MPIFNGSRYSFDSRYLGIYETPSEERKLVLRNKLVLEDEMEDWLFYTVQPGDTFDTLAYKYAEDSLKWWIIAEVNGFTGFPLDLTPGLQIKIPSRAFFEEVGNG